MPTVTFNVKCTLCGEEFRGTRKQSDKTDCGECEECSCGHRHSPKDPCYCCGVKPEQYASIYETYWNGSDWIIHCPKCDRDARGGTFWWGTGWLIRAWNESVRRDMQEE